MPPSSVARILMTTDAVGGVWVFAAGLARALGATGIHVALVTLGPRPTPAQRDMLSDAPDVSLVETDLKLEWQDPEGPDLADAAAVLGGISRRFVPDIVHLNGFREANFDWQAPTVVVAHSCVNTWATACGETGSFTGEAWNVYSRAARAGLRKADGWVAPTAAFAAQIAQQYGISNNGHVIWNGIDGIYRRKSTKQPMILGAGRLWDKAKNLTALAAVAASLEWPVRIAGPAAPNRKDISHGAQPSESVAEFLGELTHEAMLDQMQRASIFVSPARYEPFGLAVLEAASSGCALVLADIATFRELWDGAAVYFDPCDPDALRDSLRTLCRDDVQRARLQRAAVERSRRYPLRQTIDSYRSLYASVLASPSVQGPVLARSVVA